MTAARTRFRLRTRGAQRLWDGRQQSAGVFVPGLADFNTAISLVRAAAGAGDAAAGRQLRLIAAEIARVGHEVARWGKGVEVFAREELNGEAVGQREWTVGVRVYRGADPDVRNLAELIKGYDKVAARSIVVGDSARAAGKANPHRDSMEDRARMIRKLTGMAHSAGRAYRPRPRPPGRVR